MKRPIAPSTTSNREQPLFLPDSDGEQVASMSTRTPLFLPEEGEEDERPRRKKRRISTKAIQPRTLGDLWARQVSRMFFAC